MGQEAESPPVALPESTSLSSTLEDLAGPTMGDSGPSYSSAEQAVPAERSTPPDRSAEDVAIKYLDAYTHGDSKSMDSIAAEDIAYSKLIAAGFPNRLLCYMIDSAYLCSECETDSQSGHIDHFHVCANDQRGRNRYFLVRVKNSEVANIESDHFRKDVDDRNIGVPLTTADRLQIMDVVSGNLDTGEHYVRFSMGSYRGYTEIGALDAGGGAACFLRKKGGKWQELMSAQDYVLSSELDKMGVPRDVQRIVWGSTPQMDKQYLRN